jgi:hypothetical protein
MGLSHCKYIHPHSGRIGKAMKMTSSEFLLAEYRKMAFRFGILAFLFLLLSYSCSNPLDFVRIANGDLENGVGKRLTRPGSYTLHYACYFVTVLCSSLLQIVSLCLAYRSCRYIVSRPFIISYGCFLLALIMEIVFTYGKPMYYRDIPGVDISFIYDV